MSAHHLPTPQTPAGRVHFVKMSANPPLYRLIVKIGTPSHVASFHNSCLRLWVSFLFPRCHVDSAHTVHFYCHESLSWNMSADEFGKLFRAPNLTPSSPPGLGGCERGRFIPEQTPLLAFRLTVLQAFIRPRGIRKCLLYIEKCFDDICLGLFS